MPSQPPPEPDHGQKSGKQHINENSKLLSMDDMLADQIHGFRNSAGNYM